jgi:gamma-glutamyltranspeptidase/glutathione hydrolase
VDTPSTSHFSIIDAQGNAVSMTTTVEGPFGSHLMAGGMMLNNQLTDFSFRPEVNGEPVANAVAPGKRPRSSMTPVIVYDENGDLYAVLGSPGGSRIIAYVTQSLIALLDWEMDMRTAISLPRFVDRNGPLEIEAGTPLEDLKPGLEQLGHRVELRELMSGLHGIRVTPEGLDGAADPRRDGNVVTELP